MKRYPTGQANPAGTWTVLSVGQPQEDYLSFEALFNEAELELELYQADDLASAGEVLNSKEIGVVICEREMSPHTWIDMLEHLRLLRYAPPLIVTSRLADERLWAEALNLGAYDVLAKPFQGTELIRAVNLAWLRWRHERDADATAAKPA